MRFARGGRGRNDGIVGLVVVGSLMVVVAAADGFATVLHPTRRGPISFVIMKGTWMVVRALAGAVGRPGLLATAGPLAVVAVFLSWTLLLWFGFALVFWPFADSLSYSPSATYGHGFWDALYLSGMSLTTVGFGDVTGGTEALRLATVVEAATGFGVITAAITYLLSVYPLTSEMCGTARMLESQAANPERAARTVAAGGASFLHDLRRTLVGIDEDTQRFPLLYFYRSRDPSSTLSTLFAGAVALCEYARWGSADRDVRFLGEELERTLDRIFSRFVRRFLLKDPDEALRRRLEPEEATLRLSCIGAADPDDEELRRYARFAGRADAFLELLRDHQLELPATR